jgi:hypothetical protein
MKFINLTPHTINEVTTGLNIAPSGIVARISTSKKRVAEHCGVPIFHTSLGELEGLPEPVDGVVYIISALALNTVKDRLDVVSPGNLQRNEQGKPIGCLGFTQ